MNDIYILIIIGLIAGVTGGSLGIGGGIIVIPALLIFMGYSQHSAQGTSLAMMIPPIGILAAINYYKHGHIDIKASLILVVTFVIGSYFGSLIAVNISGKTLQKIFGVYLIIVALKMIFSK